VQGAIGVVQLDHDVDMAEATNAAVSAGVWLRPFRDLIYTMPQYVCTDDDLDVLIEGLSAAVRAVVPDPSVHGPDPSPVARETL
jgi:adenosylmethionine-8-amino-7-oxononanoate aminotransferase